MADNTQIEWTDATWNPITGCSVLLPGCTNCYAMKLAGARMKHHPSRAGLTLDTKAGPVWNGQVRFNEQWLTEPLRWKRPRMIFVCAHADLFHESVPDEWIDRAFAVMALAPHHTFQVLTKRSARMRDYLCTRGGDWMLRWPDANPPGSLPVSRHEQRLRMGDSGVDVRRVRFPLPNVWLGVSVEDQQRADERIPDLLATPAAVRWISAEPLLGEIVLEAAWHGESALDLECWGDCAWCSSGYPALHNCQRGRQSDDQVFKGRSGLDWVVVGGESGAKARPMHPDWARSLRDQCASAGVPFLFKQWGAWAPWDDDNWSLPDGWDDVEAHEKALMREGVEFLHVGKARAGRLLDGVEHNGFPESTP